MKKSIKILAIGNSFSVDGMEYLWQVLRPHGAGRLSFLSVFQFTLQQLPSHSE